MTQLIECGELKAQSSPSLITVAITDEIPSEGQDDVDSTDYRLEAARLDSFANWTSPTDPKKLAAAGFYYFGKDDRVRCFECRLEMRQWTKDDDPMVDHQRWSGTCRFIRKIPCGNVPIGTDPATIPPAKKLTCNDLCKLYDVQYKPNAVPDSMPEKIVAKDAMAELDNMPDSKYPEYGTYASRLLTYDAWPTTKVQEKENMSRAGFFYVGEEDFTLCYYCGGGLKDWKQDDTPVHEHVHWFSKCEYIIKVIKTMGMEDLLQPPASSTSTSDTV